MAQSGIAGRRREQFQYLVGAAGRGLSANQALNALREAGIGIGRSEGLRLYKIAQEGEKQREEVAGYDPAAPIPRDSRFRWPSKNATGRAIVVKVVARRHINGEYFDLFHRTYTNDEITPQEAIDNAIDAYSEQKYADEFSIRAAVIWNVIQYEPAGI